MPLGMEVRLGPHDFVLDGDAAPLSNKGAEPPNFRPTAGWMKMALGTELGLGSGHIVLDGDPATLSKKGAELPPNFRPISIVAKRLDAPRCHLAWR